MQAQPENILRARGGQLRMSEAIACGISRYQLYALRRRGVIEQISRGVYRLADLPALADPDLVTVRLRLPKAVVCLISALAWHEMTTQIPHRVSVAMPRPSRPPYLDHPPIETHYFSGAAYQEGIEEHPIDGVAVRIYSPEKTLADCFKFRNRLGMDVTLEALKLYRARKPVKPDDLIHYARICRVENVMRPYLEVTL
jgi:predicted transcriptional regulator of viral defense system